MKRFKQDIIIFILGGIAYCLIEIIWRRYTHWVMGIVGGLCFLTLFRLYQRTKNTPIWKKCVLGAVIITVIEFVSGCFINIYFSMNVWDYSSLPVNIMGQVCLLYSVLWGFLCIPIVYISSKLSRILR